MSELSQLRDALRGLLRDDPFARFGAHGLGVGHKVVGGQPTDRLALRFHVARKLPSSQVPDQRRIPRSLRIVSAEGEPEVEVITDVIESVPPALSQDPQSRLRPVPGSASCSSDSGAGTGTMGGWVWDNTDDTIVMLSNRHAWGAVGGEIIQPGNLDGGQMGADRIGQVKRSIAVIPFNGNPQDADNCNFVDAAVGEADNSDLFAVTVLEIGPAVFDIGDPNLGDELEKTGRTTGHTVGWVTDVPYAASIPFPGVGGDAAFCDCFRIEPLEETEFWGDNGDSGSLVFSTETGGDDVQVTFKRVLGLYFAGGGQPPNNWGMACKITNVFSALDLGPLCDGGFAAFLDALAVTESSDAVAPASFTGRERSRVRSRLASRGIARDVQARLHASQRGRTLATFADRHRAELLALLVRDGDTRRGAAAALRPLLAGAVTSTDVLAHTLTKLDLDRIDKLTRTVSAGASEELRKDLAKIQALAAGATGRSVAEVLEIAL